MAKYIKKSCNRPYKDEKTWAGSYIAGGECTAIIFLIKLSGIIL